MKSIALVIVATFGLSTAAFAQDDCTPDAIQTKSGEVAAALQSIGAKDPDRVQVLSGEIEDMMASIQNGADIRTVCAFFDKVVAEAAG